MSRNQNYKMSNKVIFFGTSEFAAPSLEALVKAGYEISAVITTPDEPAGRKQVLAPPPVKITAQKLGLKILQPEKLKGNQEFFDTLRKLLKPITYNLKPDLGIVAAYGKIIPKEIMDIFEYGIINIHPSLLPKYRGPTPIQSAILNGEKKTGITIIKIDEEVDHGPILSTTSYKLQAVSFYEEVRNELAKLGSELLIKTLPDYLVGKITLQPQDHSLATFTKKFTREDAKIDWTKTAKEIYRQIHALNPEPGTWTMWNGKILKILETKIQIPVAFNHDRSQMQLAGQVFLENEEVAIGTASSGVILKTVQLEGKKAVSAKDFTRGNRNFIGAILG